ncbi:MAG: hypothetical protein ABWY93_29055 [Mycobacterium sp.]
MSSRACAALIADMAFHDNGSAAERRPVKAAEKTKRRTRRFRRPQAD